MAKGHSRSSRPKNQYYLFFPKTLYIFREKGFQICFQGLTNILEFLNKHQANKIPKTVKCYYI